MPPNNIQKFFLSFTIFLIIGIVVGVSYFPSTDRGNENKYLYQLKQNCEKEKGGTYRVESQNIYGKYYTVLLCLHGQSWDKMSFLRYPKGDVELLSTLNWYTHAK